MAENGEPLSLPKRQLGYYLRQARDEAGLSLAEAAAHIGRSAPTLMRIEKGLTQKLSLPEIEAFCRLYQFDHVTKQYRDADEHSRDKLAAEFRTAAGEWGTDPK